MATLVSPLAEGEQELALPLAAVAPAMLQAVRGERAGGEERASRNLGANALLGGGAAALAAALLQPEAVPCRPARRRRRRLRGGGPASTRRHRGARARWAA